MAVNWGKAPWLTFLESRCLATEKDLSGRGGPSDIQAAQPAVLMYPASVRSVSSY